MVEVLSLVDRDGLGCLVELMDFCPGDLERVRRLPKLVVLAGLRFLALFSFLLPLAMTQLW